MLAKLRQGKHNVYYSKISAVLARQHLSKTLLKEDTKPLPIEIVIKSLATLAFATEDKKLLIDPNGRIGVDERYVQPIRRMWTDDGAETLVQGIERVRENALHYISHEDSFDHENSFKKNIIKKLLPLMIRGLENPFILFLLLPQKELLHFQLRP